VSWQPSASWDTLKARAALLRKIREFFYQRDVLEVDTPLLSQATVTDPHLSPLSVEIDFLSTTYYLQTSPEYAMKRLLADGAESIYQITKAFRDDEVGSKHNPEFTMLEWYRLGWDHVQLIGEVNKLLSDCLGCESGEILSYHDLFQYYLQVNPHTATENELQRIAKENIDIGDMVLDDADAWLDLLFSHCIEPNLGKAKPTFVVEYPQSQAALAKVVEVTIDGAPTLIAQRFEVFFAGVELANGYHELTDAEEQRVRFNREIDKCSRLGKTRVLDSHFMSALESEGGLPSCAGVALGVDRLLMLMTGQKHLSDVLAFDFTRA